MRIRILGSVEIHDGVEWRRAGPSKRCAVLAALAVAAGEPLSLKTLTERVWGSRPPSAAIGTLYGHIAHLRKQLGDSSAITRRGADGYQLDLPPTAIDLRVTRERAARARAAARHRPAEADRAWGECLALWRGEPLAGVGGEWAAKTRQALEAERLGMLAERCDVALARGRHAAIIPELHELLTRHPFTETLVAQLMLALYRAGRPDEALTRFAVLRERLADERGVEPMPELRDLHRRILNRDPGLSVPPRRPIEPSAPVAPAQLPADTRAFTGRTDLLERMCGGAEGSTVLAIDGLAGTGKTALAVRVAHRLAARFPDGQLFVDLHGFSGDPAPLNPAEALGRLLRAFGVADLPTNVDERSSLWRSTLAGRRVLVVLDNAASEAQVRPLLPGADGCLVLITSRRKLPGLDDVDAHSLDVLSASEASELFVRVSGLAERHPDVTRVVEVCGRLPLALRIAAARLRNRPQWTVGDLLRRLEASLAAWEAGSRNVAAAFDVSYRDLDDGPRRLFRLLGVHPGPDLTADAAAALGELSPGDAERFVDVLLDANLASAADDGRFRLHDLVRRFAREVAEPDESRAALARLREHYVTSAGAASVHIGDSLSGLPQPEPASTRPTFAGHAEALSWFTAERPNLMALLRGGADAPGFVVALADRVWPFVHHHTLIDDMVTTSELALRAARERDDPMSEGKWHNLSGLACASVDRYHDAVGHYERALEVRDRIGDARGAAATHNNLGNVMENQGDHAQALRHFEAAIELAENAADPAIGALARGNAATAQAQAGSLDAAVSNLDEAIATFRRLNNPREEVRCLLRLAEVHNLANDPDAAVPPSRRVIEYCREHAEPEGEAAALAALAEALNGLGRHAEALTHLDRARDLLRHVRRPSLEASILNRMARAHGAVGDWRRATGLYRAAAEITERIGHRTEHDIARRGLAEAARPRRARD